MFAKFVDNTHQGGTAAKYYIGAPIRDSRVLARVLACAVCNTRVHSLGTRGTRASVKLLVSSTVTEPFA